VLVLGCTATDPLLNPEDWHPTGSNAMNLAAEVDNPADLVRGRQSVGGTDGGMAALAVQRLRTNHVKPLPDSGISDLRVQSSPSSAGSP
jgi:type IV pilus biogenesis protein CpaD/CtpE